MCGASRHAHGGAPLQTCTPQVYESTEALFGALSEEARKHGDWLVLADVAGDLDEHVEATLGSADGGDASSADWELNLRSLQGAARDLERLPCSVRRSIERRLPVRRSSSARIVRTAGMS